MNTTSISGLSPKEYLPLTTASEQDVIEYSFNTLPKELILLIFGDLSKYDLVRSAKVCKAWKKVVENTPLLWKKILPFSPNTDNGISELTRFNHIYNNLKTGNSLNTILLKDYVLLSAFSSDSNKVATLHKKSEKHHLSSSEFLISIFDTTSGAKICTSIDLPRNINVTDISIEFSEDNSKILAYWKCSPCPTLHFWDATTGVYIGLDKQANATIKTSSLINTELTKNNLIIKKAGSGFNIVSVLSPRTFLLRTDYEFKNHWMSPDCSKILIQLSLDLGTSFDYITLLADYSISKLSVTHKLLNNWNGLTGFFSSKPKGIKSEEIPHFK